MIFTTPARVEACESRRLLSAATAEASLHHHVLAVRGVADDANVVTVVQDTAAHTLTVTVVSTPVSTPASAMSSHSDDEGSEDAHASDDSHEDASDDSTSAGTVTFSKTFDAAGVKLVAVRGGKLADVISLVNADGATPFSLDAGVFGDDGNDTITTGSGDDRVDGGKGDDVVDAGAGNDLLWGGKGNDQLVGGDGNDTLFGGSGNDTMTAGAGDDVVFSLVGTDSVVGGAGSDTFVTKKLKHGHGPLKDFGKHDHQKVVKKTGGDPDDAPATA